jgi:chromosome segregation ATPase
MTMEQHNCINENIINNLTNRMDKNECKIEGLEKDSIKSDILLKQMIEDKKEQSEIIKELASNIKDSSNTMNEVKFTMKEIQNSLQENKTDIDSLNSSFHNFKTEFYQSENKNKIDLRDIQKEVKTNWLKENWTKVAGIGGGLTLLGFLYKLIDVLNQLIPVITKK